MGALSANCGHVRLALSRNRRNSAWRHARTSSFRTNASSRCSAERGGRCSGGTRTGKSRTARRDRLRMGCAVLHSVGVRLIPQHPRLHRWKVELRLAETDVWHLFSAHPGSYGALGSSRPLANLAKCPRTVLIVDGVCRFWQACAAGINRSLHQLFFGFSTRPPVRSRGLFAAADLSLDITARKKKMAKTGFLYR
jgi:hypothetical protein